MNENFLNKLEYNKILELLDKECLTYFGKELCFKLRPIFKQSKVTKLLQETDEACTLAVRKGNLPISSIPNIEIYIKNLSSSNSLNAKGLLDVARILKLSRELRITFIKMKILT